MSPIVLIRHAETDLAGKFCGHSDPELNAAGQKSLVPLAGQLAPLGISNILSSDLRRAAQTAIALADRLRLSVQFKPGLREIYFGRWEGLSWEEIEQRFPHEARLWIREFPTRPAPGGEAHRDFVARVEAEFTAIIDGDKTDTRAMVAVVTHRGVMEYALTRFFGFSEHAARKQTAKCGATVVAREPSLPDVNFMRLSL